MMHYLHTIWNKSQLFHRHKNLANILHWRTQKGHSEGLKFVAVRQGCKKIPSQGKGSNHEKLTHLTHIKIESPIFILDEILVATLSFVDNDAFTYLQVLLLLVLPLLIVQQILLTTSTLSPDRLSHLNLNSSDKSLPQDNPISKNLISHKNNSASRTRIEGLMVDCEEQEGGGEVEGGGGELVNSDLSSYSVHYNYVKARYMKWKAWDPFCLTCYAFLVLLIFFDIGPFKPCLKTTWYRRHFFW